MNFREWPLVIFTLLFQAAAGTAIFFCFAAEKNDRLGAALLIFIAAVLSALLSLFHLGRPFRAPRSIVNLRLSWLSREILFLLAFGAAATAEVADSIFDLGAEDFLRPAAALFGAACILMMSKIYMLPAVPDWNSWRTPGAFFSSAFVLGGLIGGLYTGILKAPLLGVLFAAFLFNLIFSPRFGLAGRRTTPLGFRPNPSWPAVSAVRLGLLAAAILLWAAGIVFPAANRAAGIASLVAAVLSELIGRLQFYDIPLGLSPRKS